MGAISVYDAVHYWLVDHPIISQYEWKPGQSPATSRHFLMTAVTAYVSLTLLFRYFPILPTIPPTVLRPIAVAHNAILCFLSLIMAIGCALSAVHQTPSGNPTWVICFPAGGATVAQGPTFFWGHVFYLSKVLEFGDTVLILLSGSRGSRRMSFLHVYHHAVVPITWYLCLEMKQSLFPVGFVTNAAVHVLMYGYYLAVAVGRRPSWKRTVTNCQITQFLFAYPASVPMLYLHFTGPGCSGMRAWVFSMLFSTSLLVLFINFHFKNYKPIKHKSI